MVTFRVCGEEQLIYQQDTTKPIAETLDPWVVQPTVDSRRVRTARARAHTFTSGIASTAQESIPQGLKPACFLLGRAKAEALAYLEAKGPRRPEAEASGYQPWVT